MIFSYKVGCLFLIYTPAIVITQVLGVTEKKRYTNDSGYVEIRSESQRETGIDVTNIMYHIQPQKKANILLEITYDSRSNRSDCSSYIKVGREENKPTLSICSSVFNHFEKMVGSEGFVHMYLNNDDDYRVVVRWGGYDEFNRDKGGLTSPSYPLGYPIRYRKYHVISISAKYLVLFILETLMLQESSRGICVDYLQAFVPSNGGSSKAVTEPLCRLDRQSHVIYAGHRTLVLILQTDHQYVGSGFTGKWAPYQLYGQPGGRLTSPGFPYYSANQTMYYHIHPPEPHSGTQLLLVFTHLNMEEKDENGTCPDWITLHDGKLEAAAVAPEYICGYSISSYASIAKGYPSISNEIMIHFQSNDKKHYEGFMLEYGYIQEFQLDYGTIMLTTARFSQNQRLYYRIALPSHTKLRLRIKKFHLEPRNPYDCVQNYLMIYDGDFINAPLFGTFCGDELKEGQTFSGKNNAMFLTFYSSASAKISSFHITWTVYQSSLIDDKGEIKTPNYPNLYDANERIDYTVSLRTPGRLVLEFLSFQLSPRSRDRCNDRVIVYDLYEDGPFLGEFCGDDLARHRLIKSSGSKIVIHLETYSQGGTGFLARFGKFEEIIADFGSLSSPGFVTGSLKQRIYYWIKLGSIGTVRIIFDFFELNRTRNGNDERDVLELYSGTSGTMGTLIGTFHDREIEAGQYFDMDGASVLVVYTSDGHGERQGFLLRWHSILNSPPPKFTMQPLRHQDNILVTSFPAVQETSETIDYSTHTNPSNPAAGVTSQIQNNVSIFIDHGGKNTNSTQAPYFTLWTKFPTGALMACLAMFLAIVAQIGIVLIYYKRDDVTHLPGKQETKPDAIVEEYVDEVKTAMEDWNDPQDHCDVYFYSDNNNDKI